MIDDNSNNRARMEFRRDQKGGGMESNHILILGNGPSLADFNLRSFSDIPTIGMNAAYRYWDRIGWFPTYYACLDDTVVVSHQEKIKEMVQDDVCEAFFLHQNILRDYPGLAFYPNVFILSSFLDNALHVDARVKVRVPVLDFKCIRSYRTDAVTTGAMAIRFAKYLGYQKMMVLGVDANYIQIIDGASQREGTVLEMERTPKTNPNYFFDDYQKDGDRYNLPTPPSRIGNMHLNTISDAVEELKQDDPDFEIFTGTVKSKVYSHKVMPFLSVEDFLATGRGSPRKLRSKDEPPPPYVPVSPEPIIFARMKLKGARQTDVDKWRVDSNAVGLEECSIGFVFAKIGEWQHGEELRVTAKIAASEDVSARVRLCRDDQGTYESTQEIVDLSTELREVALSLNFKERHETVRFEVSLSSPVSVQISEVTAYPNGS